MSFDPGTTPSRNDTKWRILAKTLQAIQDSLSSPNPDNNPAASDSIWRLLYKIARARAGL